MTTTPVALTPPPEADPLAASPARLGFLIFACPKSGTTWVQRMLSAHPLIHCGESRAFGGFYNPANPSAPHLALDRFFTDFFSRYHHGPVDRNADPAAFADFYRRLTHRIVDTIAMATLDETGRPAANGQRKSIYGEKATPPAAGTAAAILAGYRDYRADLPLIHLIRDGRDVAVSGFVQRANNLLNYGRPSEAEARSLRTCLDEQRIPDSALAAWAEEWRDAVAAGRAAVAACPNALEIRYESILADPLAACRAMLDLIGRSSRARAEQGATALQVRIAEVGADDDATVRACVEAAAFDRLSGGRARGHEDRGSFFRKGIAGDWRYWLSADQQAWYASSPAGALLRDLGYPDHDASAVHPAATTDEIQAGAGADAHDVAAAATRSVIRPGAVEARAGVAVVGDCGRPDLGPCACRAGGAAGERR